MSFGQETTDPMTHMQRTLSSLTILLSLAGGLAGCGDDGAANGGPKLLVHGRVDANLDNSSTTVEAYAIAEDGSREPVDMEPTATDGSRRYRLESTVELRAGTQVLIEATDGATDASVVVLVDADGEMTAEPITEETSLEAAVFVSLAASSSCDDCSFEAIRATVEAEAAATFASGDQSEATLADLSAALEAQIDAQATSLRSGSSSAFDAYVSARAEAQADEIIALDAATTAQATAQAHADFEQALADARSSGSLTAQAWAESAHAGAEALRAEAESVQLDGALMAQLVADAELERAVSVQAAMEAELSAAGVSNVDLDATFATLMASIDAARADGASAGESIANAWGAALVSIRADISTSLGGAAATAFDAWVTLSTSAITTLRANAVVSGGSSVDTALLLSGGLSDLSVDVSALTTAGVDAAAADAFVSILLHAELAATAE